MNSGLKHCTDSLHDTQLRALSLWAQQRFEAAGPAGGRERRRRLDAKQASALRAQTFVLAFLGHIRVVNALVDGVFAKALVLSYFENHFVGAPEPAAIFSFIQERFAVLPAVDAPNTAYGRGKAIFRLMRCLHLHKGSSVTLTLLFVCACRCYEVSARLVGGVYGPGSNVALLAEAFDTDVGAWKRADFTRMVYDGVAYGARSSAKPLNRESEARYALPESCEHRGRLYVHRQNKLFVYNLGEELSVAAIVVFSKPVTGRVVLNVAEFPFEEEEFRLRLVQSKQKPGAKEPPREYAYVFGCNRLGWLSELTPKYVERYNDICVKRGQPLQDWITETLELLNDRLRSLPGIGIVSLLERAEAKWMDARISNDPLPASKNKLKNHPIYVLASQIGNNRIKKSGAAPIAYLKGEEVFLRSDLEELKTRGGWRKVNRRVLDDAQPITARRAYDKRTRMHVVASLFSESQTELVPQAEAADGGIPTTQYDNVDATGKRFIPQGTIYLRSKRPELLFRAARALGISHKRAFSSYQKVDAFKPEIDGVVVRKGDLPALLTRYEELAAEATEREFEAHKESYRNFWRSVFKTLLADPPSVAQEHHRSIRRKLNDQVTSFLNRLEHIS